VTNETSSLSSET